MKRVVIIGLGLWISWNILQNHQNNTYDANEEYRPNQNISSSQMMEEKNESETFIPQANHQNLSNKIQKEIANPSSNQVYYNDKSYEKNEMQTPEPQSSVNNSNFTCDGRTRCTQMTSCEEATFFIENCPNTKMDGNKDGVPCESQWCGG